MLRPRLIAIVLAFLTLLVFSRATHNGFVHYDDDEYLVRNAHIHHGLTPAAVAWAWTATQGGNYHPVTWLAHELDWQFFGNDPGGHHLASVALHALNAALVFLLLHRLTGAVWRSAIVAALFAVHPLRVESVAWAAELKDVLSATFGLLALLAYAHYARRPSAWRMLGVSAWFTLGLLAKPMLVTLPFVMLLLDVWPLRRGIPPGGRGDPGRAAPLPWARLAAEKAPLLALSALACVVTFIVQRRAGAVAPWEYIAPATRFSGALIGYALYLGKTFWPFGLAILYPRPDAWPWAQTVLAGLLLLVITALAVALRRRVPAVLVGWLWFLGMLVPVIGIVQAGAQSIADRYTYLPHVGLLMALVWGLDWAWGLGLGAWGKDPRPQASSPKPIPMGLAALAVALLAILSWRQLGVWHDAYTLFLHASRVTSNNYLAYTNLGAMLADQPGREPESLEDFRQAWLAGPRVPNTYANYGLALARAGQLGQAEDLLREAVRLDPAALSPRINLATLLERQGRLDPAATEYRQALAHDPASPPLHGRLAVVLAQMGQWPEAVREMEIALTAVPPGTAAATASVGPGGPGEPGQPAAALANWLQAHPQNDDLRFMYGLALAQSGQRDAAAAQFRMVLQHQPGDPRAASALRAASGAASGAASDATMPTPSGNRK